MWTLVDHNNIERKSGNDTLLSRLPAFDDVQVEDILSGSVHRAPARRVWRVIAATLLSVLLLLVLFAQAGYRHLDSLSQHEVARPWLLTVCQYARCVVPVRQDAALISSVALNVAPHEQLQDITQVQAIFRNDASFPQPLPVLELRFSDTDGRTMAGRRFTPSEYLAPADNQSTTEPDPRGTLMPGATITARLTLADPGAEAVNYQLGFQYD